MSEILRLHQIPLCTKFEEEGEVGGKGCKRHYTKSVSAPLGVKSPLSAQDHNQGKQRHALLDALSVHRHGMERNMAR